MIARIIILITILYYTAEKCSADIIFLLDRKAANRQGHIAVMIGNEITGWRYVSLNGTGNSSKPWGTIVNSDTCTSITDSLGRTIKGMRQAIKRSNNINPSENHKYNFFRRIECSVKEDIDALNAACKIAKSGIYGIFGPGKSCIDVAQAAFASLCHIRTKTESRVPGQTDLIPKRWFDKLDRRVRIVNKQIERHKTIKFKHPLNKKNRIINAKLKPKLYDKHNFKKLIQNNNID